MAKTPWLTIIGIGEDGLNGLSEASRNALDAATCVIGAPRHLALASVEHERAVSWPTPFSIAPVLKRRGKDTVVLTSGDPFWFGAGGSLAGELSPEEYCVHPAPSTFSLCAARLGWRLEETTCLGLHARPLDSLVPHLTSGAKCILLLRDGQAPAELADELKSRGFGESTMHVMEAMGGPRQRITSMSADDFKQADYATPVAIAIECNGPPQPAGTGLPDDAFITDGQITKRTIRAITLSTLAPRRGEHLWDIGAGSGSITIEWLRLAETMTAVAIEKRPDRISNIEANAARFGVTSRLDIVEGDVLDVIPRLDLPDAVFIGGGASQQLLDTLWEKIPPNTRLVANSVTLETEMLLVAAQERWGGHLTRLDVSEAIPLGPKHVWRASYPVVQWSAMR